MSPAALALLLAPACFAYLLAQCARESEGAGRVGFEFGMGACFVLEYILVAYGVEQAGMTGIGAITTSTLVSMTSMILTHVTIRLARGEDD
jgi:hypothetical protein